MATVATTPAASLRAEFARIFHDPSDTLGTLTFNAVLVFALWYLAPRALFFDLTGPEGLPYALAGWMFADVCATNILAPDRTRALLALGDRDELVRFLRAKSFALWLLVGPACAVLAVFLAVDDHDWRGVTVVMLSVTVVPFGAITLSNVIGFALPYHPRPLRWRWEQRARTKQVVVRWAILLVIPYAIYPAAAAAVVAIPLGLWRLTRHLPIGTDAKDADFILCALMVAAISMAVWIYGYRLLARWATRDTTRLRRYLENLEMG
ncbi:hypothetical protein GCM10027169_17810 [Gordonia jinhuaensis]|uniref:Uncharacterized protein n=1 Tax=Gordonia jinhuaensis TaxID=1517702 RepID=A0A916X189_9ACTN|nr:hypothetical protein [Gordonia jinhuaensis]GGB47114.1 hypothetical protein GCM10011489_37930 [Gordonia jinhuaensis]